MKSFFIQRVIYTGKDMFDIHNYIIGIK